MDRQHGHKRRPLNSTLGHLNPIHLTLHILMIHFSITLVLLILRPSSGLLLPDKFFFSHVCYMFILQCPQFDQPNNNLSRIQPKKLRRVTSKKSKHITKFLIIPFPSTVLLFFPCLSTNFHGIYSQICFTRIYYLC
jgi:hypothetical protein